MPSVVHRYGRHAEGGYRIDAFTEHEQWAVDCDSIYDGAVELELQRLRGNVQRFGNRPRPEPTTPMQYVGGPLDGLSGRVDARSSMSLSRLVRVLASHIFG